LFADLNSGLEFAEVPRTGELGSCGIEAILNEWLEHDHHDKDPVFYATFEAKTANSRIPV
jgi:hypothetical protein